MAHKTFISYKYEESKELRDRIIRALGESATFYQGETSDSPDLGNYTTDYIKSILADMIYDTTVMIVIVSPNMIYSKWMEWEINYALGMENRKGIISHTNGIVCVVKNIYTREIINSSDPDPTKWAKLGMCWNINYFFPIIYKNMMNRKYSYLPENYIDIVSEDDFMENPLYYIERAYNKSRYIEGYRISKWIFKDSH